MVPYSDYLTLFNRYEFMMIQYWLTWIALLFYILAFFFEKSKVKSMICLGLGVLFVFSAFFHCFS